MLNCSRATFSSVVVTALETYLAYWNKAWELGSTADMVFAISSIASIGGMIMSTFLRWWRIWHNQSKTKLKLQ